MTSRPAGASRQREDFGRYYEDFAIGDVYEHRPGRTISEADNTWFTLLTMNTHPLHVDHAYAARSEFGKPVVNSCLTLSMVVGMSVTDVSYKAIANLGWDEVRLGAPVFAGDTLYAESEVLSKRPSAKRPTQGLVTVRTIGKNQEGTEVIGFERTVLVPLRGHGVEDE
jgi:itaconyl-CoA hydratase